MAHWSATFLAATLLSSHIFVSIAKETLEECSDDASLTGAPKPSLGDQLLQVGLVNRHLNFTQKASIQCADADIGNIIPLNDDGLRDVAVSCCYDDMKAFVRRLAEEANLKVCNEGGLSGFAPYYSCSNTTSLEQMKSEMLLQVTEKAPCRWLGLADEECVPVDPSCGVSTNPDQEESMLKGYIGLDAENNPPALVTNTAIKEQLTQDIAAKLGVPTSSVKVVIGTGPVGSVSLYQVSMKSSQTGKYVEAGPNGDLVANSASFKTFDVRHQHGENFLMTGGSKQFSVKWNKEKFSFETDDGEDAVEDDEGHVIFLKNPEKRLQVDFPGSRSLGINHQLYRKHGTSLVELRRSCTVMASFEVLQTDPPSIDQNQVKSAAEDMDVKEFQSLISHDLDEIEPCLGAIEISTMKFCKEKGACKNKSLKPAHSDREYDHEGNQVPEEKED